jgi:PmbA protein
VDSKTLKLGVVDSEIASVRTQSEVQTAVRLIENGRIGLASAVGHANMDQLTQSAREALVFDVAYPSTPEGPRSLSCSHRGDRRGVAELVEITSEVLNVLRSEFPDFVFSYGVEQQYLSWQITSDAGLDLSYERDTTQLAFLVKEKGSGNIFDSFVGVEGGTVDVDATLHEFRRHLHALSRPLPAQTGRQRVVFPGLSGMAGSGLLSLIRSDLVGRVYAKGASVFDGQANSETLTFSPSLTLFERRDPQGGRVCPFDMEGVIRTALDMNIVEEGRITALAANKRDAHRFDLEGNGTAIGDAAQLPSSGFGQIVAQDTAKNLSDLLGPEGGLLVWFVAGGNSTRTGDMAFPAHVLMAIDGNGELLGRAPGATLTGNIFDVLGRDYVGSTSERVGPFSEEGFFVTHMTVQG